MHHLVTEKGNLLKSLRGLGGHSGPFQGDLNQNDGSRQGASNEMDLD